MAVILRIKAKRTQPGRNIIIAFNGGIRGFCHPYAVTFNTEIELDVISKFLLPGNDLLKIEIPLLKAPEMLLFLITFFLLAQILIPLIPSLAEE